MVAKTFFIVWIVPSDGCKFWAGAESLLDLKDGEHPFTLYMQSGAMLVFCLERLHMVTFANEGPQNG
jgi:hypothetical protein